jgi:maltodextrin utilization protein YvdJ
MINHNEFLLIHFLNCDAVCNCSIAFSLFLAASFPFIDYRVQFIFLATSLPFVLYLQYIFLDTMMPFDRRL